MDKLMLSIVNETEGFYALKEEWNELLKRSNSDNVFLIWEWLYNWWLIYGRSHKLLIIIIRDGHQLISIAPLYIKIGSLSGVKEIRFLGSNIVCSEYLDFILLKTKEEKLLRLIFSCLKENNDRWDILNFTDMPLESGSLNVLNSLFQGNGIKINRNYRTCPYIKIEPDWKVIHESFSSQLRNTIKKKSKRLKRMTGNKFYELSANDDLNFYFTEFVRTNIMRMNMKSIRSPFLDKRYYNFHYSIVKELFGKGMVELIFLKVKGELIAAIYLLHYDGKYYYYQSGFNPKWSHISPGTLLFNYCIKKAHSRKLKEFDFLQGDEDYKKNWTEKIRTSTRVAIYNNSIKGYGLRYLDDGIDKAKRIKRHIFTYVRRILPCR